MQLPEKTSTKQADLQVWAAIQSLTTIVEVPIFRQRMMSVIGLSAGRQQTASTAHSAQRTAVLHTKAVVTHDPMLPVSVSSLHFILDRLDRYCFMFSHR